MNTLGQAGAILQAPRAKTPSESTAVHTHHSPRHYSVAVMHTCMHSSSLPEITPRSRHPRTN